VIVSQSTIVALVTGANKGIGKEIARQLGAQGMTVLLAARDAARGEQAATELSIETRRSEKPKSVISSETLTFKLDGSENSVQGNYGVQIKAKAHWDGTKLITETERSIQGSTVTTTQVFSLDASRKEMTVDNTLTVQHGYQSQGANNTGRGKDVFIKSRRSVNK